MIHCARCHRPMRAPSETGLGPKCQVAVLGRKPKPRRVDLLMECKDGRRPPSDRQLTIPQQEWIAAWRGAVHVVLSADDALRALGVLK